MTQISLEKPPIWDEAVKYFQLDGRYGTIFTYGDTIYNPFKVHIPDDLIHHEEVHVKQQAAFEGGPETWWKRYFDDVEFRVSQEVEAYGAQYKFICKNVKDRNRRNDHLVELAHMLSGPMYGNPVSFFEAMNRIRKSSGVVR